MHHSKLLILSREYTCSYTNDNSLIFYLVKLKMRTLDHAYECIRVEVRVDSFIIRVW